MRVLAPQNLFHPVFPSRMANGRLVFTLCSMCSLKRNLGQCNHTPIQRSIVGTWCSPEIKLALKMGYKILKVYEVWHFAKTKKWDGENIKSGLFTKYILTLMKLKAEASGYPSWVKTQEDKESYCASYYQTEGIRLDPSKIKLNPGMRGETKTALNCLFGKLSQRENLPSTEVFRDVDAFLDAVFDTTLDIKSFYEIGDRAVVVSKKKEVYSDIKSATTNVVLSAYITSLARVELYKTLHQVGERAIYYDTDSIIYISRPGEPEPEISDRLGGWKNELSPGNHIVEIAVGGCKNYSYRTLLPENGSTTKTVIKGFTLHWLNAQVLNHESLTELVKKYDQSTTENATISTRNPSYFERDKTEPAIYLKEQEKTYQVVLDKRWLDQDSKICYPFGYNKI